jgi:hypothetical protein
MNVRAVVVTVATALVTSLPAFAGPNDFFGGNIGNAGDSQQGGQTAVNAPPTTAPGGDYTADEKRMQKKYKLNVKDAERLIAKADAMTKSADKKISKKGKILKEIGEKRLADLKANNPFAEIANSGLKTH